MHSSNDMARAQSCLDNTALAVVYRVHLTTGEKTYCALGGGYSVSATNARIVTKAEAAIHSKQAGRDDCLHTYHALPMQSMIAVLCMQEQIDNKQSSQPMYWLAFNARKVKETLDNRRNPC